MSVILYYVIFIFASTARLGSDCVRVSQPVGASPRYRPLRIILVSKLDSASFQPPPPGLYPA